MAEMFEEVWNMLVGDFNWNHSQNSGNDSSENVSTNTSPKDETK